MKSLTTFLFLSISTLSNAQFQTFQSAGELQVAVGQFMSTEFEEVSAVAGKYGDISEWNVSLVDDMKGLFQDYGMFNENISAWETGNVLDISRMFL